MLSSQRDSTNSQRIPDSRRASASTTIGYYSCRNSRLQELKDRKIKRSKDPHGTPATVNGDNRVWYLSEDALLSCDLPFHTAFEFWRFDEILIIFISKKDEKVEKSMCILRKVNI